MVIAFHRQIDVASLIHGSLRYYSGGHFSDKGAM